MNVAGKLDQMILAEKDPLRVKLEAKIEELIALLDVIDGDCDLEDNGDAEPSISSPVIMINGKPECDLEWEDWHYEPSGDEGDVSRGRFEGGSGL